MQSYVLTYSGLGEQNAVFSAKGLVFCIHVIPQRIIMMRITIIIIIIIFIDCSTVPWMMMAEPGLEEVLMMN